MKHKNMKQYEEKNDPMLNHGLQKERVKSVISCFALAVICGSLKAGCFLPSC